MLAVQSRMRKFCWNCRVCKISRWIRCFWNDHQTVWDLCSRIHFLLGWRQLSILGRRRRRLWVFWIWCWFIRLWCSFQNIGIWIIWGHLLWVWTVWFSWMI